MRLTLTLLVVLAVTTAAQKTVRTEDSTDAIIEQLKLNPTLAAHEAQRLAAIPTLERSTESYVVLEGADEVSAETFRGIFFAVTNFKRVRGFLLHPRIWM